MACEKEAEDVHSQSHTIKDDCFNNFHRLALVQITAASILGVFQNKFHDYLFSPPRQTSETNSETNTNK